MRVESLARSRIVPPCGSLATSAPSPIRMLGNSGPRFAAWLNNSWAGIESSGTTKTGTPVDRTVAHMNVEHYQRLLAAETDEPRRQILLRLLAEEEAKIPDPASPDKTRS